MKIEEEVKLDFKDVLIKPRASNLSSRSEVSLFRDFKFSRSKKNWSGIPIVASNMDGVGTISMAKELSFEGILTCLTKDHTVDQFSNIYETAGISVSTGISDADFERLTQILEDYPHIPFVCIDVANGYMEALTDYIRKVALNFPRVTIIAGNVVCPQRTLDLIHAGADIVKVGIGSGAVCTTRIQTGIGYPQLSAIIECAEVAHQHNAYIMSDGGCSSPGDVAKAFGAGADFVMLGSMFAGHSEGGQHVDSSGNITFYGMSSDTAMMKHHGGIADYRTSEGRTVNIKQKGPVSETVRNLLGGLRSSCTYVGASNLKSLPKKTTFVRVNRQYNDTFT